MKSEIKIKGASEKDGIATVLENLIDSFKEGTVCLERGREFLILKPLGEIDFEISAATKKSKQKLSLELSWRTEAMEEVPEVEFKISSREPEIEAPAEDEAAVAEDALCQEEKIESY